MADLIAGFQALVAEVPLLVQPLIIVLAAAVPFIEGEGSALIGVIGGVHPVVAAIAAVVGNLACVVLVVLLGSRIRAAVVARRARRRAAAGEAPPDRVESKGRRRVRGWLLRFGVPGASLLAPLALPTPFTAATLAASGVHKGWVILWQGVAIVLWTTVVTLGAVGLMAAAEG